MIQKLPLLALGLALFSSCSFSADGMRTINVRVRPEPAVDLNRMLFQKNFSGPTIDTMDCLAVAVSGPGLAPNGCVPSVSSVLVPPTQNVISLRVPSGGKRLVQVMGLSTGSGCQTGKTLTDELTSTPVASWPTLYMLGQGTFDVFKDSNVRIDQSYDPATSGTFLFPACINSTFKTVVYTVSGDGSISILHYDPVNHATTLFDTLQDGNLNTPVAITIDPSSKFLFVNDTAGPSIATYFIKNLDGDLSFLGKSNVTHLDKVLAAQAGTNYILGYDGSTISRYQYTTAGAVTFVNQVLLPKKPDAPHKGKALVPPPAGPWMVIDPQGRAVYTSTTFQMNSTPISAGTFGGTSGVSGTGPLAITPTGTYLYAGNPTSGNTNLYVINGDGSLPSPVAVGTSSNMTSAAVDLTGRFLFMGDAGGSIDSFSISTGTGALTAINTVVAGASVQDIKLDPLDTAVFTFANANSQTQQLILDPNTGALGAAIPQTVTGVPVGIAIAKIPLSFAPVTGP